jgi:hypothetical protein
MGLTNLVGFYMFLTQAQKLKPILSRLRYKPFNIKSP